MCKRLVFVCLVLAVLHIPEPLYAQFTDARAYDNAPVGINQFELDYGYARTNTSIDTSLIVAGAELTLNQGTIDYTRYFSAFHRMAWFKASVPLAGLDGSVNGAKIEASRTGAGDSSYEVAMLLKGGPALSVQQFADYKQVTTIAVSLTVTAPTGEYNGKRLLNLGADRWFFKPELAVSYPFGPDRKWEVDAYVNGSFFTNDASFHGGEVLRQQALPGVEGHLSYSFTKNLWVSVDTRYSFRGDTFVDGVDQHNAQQNFILGSEANLSLNPRNSLVFEFAKALVHKNGPDQKGFVVKYIYSWGKGYR